MNRTRVDRTTLEAARSKKPSNQTDRISEKKPRKEKNPYKALKMQQALTRIGYAKRTTVKQRIQDVESFEQFPLLPSIQEAILPRVLGVVDATPTPIQKLAIPALLGVSPGRRRREAPEKMEFLLAAETGSGKTLAYMIPAIDALKRAEMDDAERATSDEVVAEKEEQMSTLDLFDREQLEADEAKLKAGRPKIIVLVPTAELVDQVGKTAKAFSHSVKFRAALISSSYSNTVIRNRLFAPTGVDVLVSTPQLLANIIRSRPSVVSRCTHLIVDEADSLLEKSFEEFTTEIVDRARPTLEKLIMCSATIPRRMDNYLRSHYPDVVRLTTPNLHAIPRRVQLSVVDCEKGNFFGNKKLACADTIWNIGKSATNTADLGDASSDKDVKRVVVFVNEREQTVEVADYLQSKGIDATALSRDTDARLEKDLIAEFTEADNDAGHGMSEVWQKSRVERKLDNVRVLVTTDLASRGIDTTPVRDVILYDVPHSTIDFIHRLGRTGRMGRRGRGFVLVGKNDRRDVVSEVKHGMFRGQALI